jgi:hypothetical protein
MWVFTCDCKRREMEVDVGAWETWIIDENGEAIELIRRSEGQYWENACCAECGEPVEEKQP